MLLDSEDAAGPQQAGRPIQCAERNPGTLGQLLALGITLARLPVTKRH